MTIFYNCTLKIKNKSILILWPQDTVVFFAGALQLGLFPFTKAVAF